MKFRVVLVTSRGGLITVAKTRRVGVNMNDDSKSMEIYENKIIQSRN